jgi:hypothetical protein
LKAPSKKTKETFEMRLRHVEKLVERGRVRLTGKVQIADSEELDVWFEYADEFADFICESGDAFVPALLIASMYRAEKLDIEVPISYRLFSNIARLQDIYAQFHPEKLTKIQFTAARYEELAWSSNIYVGAFFSLGVDSFYTLHKDMAGRLADSPPISHLIYMTGLELPLRRYNQNQEDAVKSTVSLVAKEAKKNCIFGSTNVRDALLNFGWGLYCYGAGLASVALSLSERLGHVLINSTHPYTYVIPWGSSPMFDHLWSSEKVNIVHIGSEVGRAEKIYYSLSNDALAMKYLRTCVDNEGGVGNCGCCYKCTRTMTSLYIAGKLGRVPVFPSRLDWRALKKDFVTRNDLGYAEENLKLAKEHSKDKRLTRLLERQIEDAKAEEFFRGKTFVKALVLAMSWYLFTAPKQRVIRFLRNVLRRMEGKSEFWARVVAFLRKRRRKYGPRNAPTREVDDATLRP